MPVNGRAAAPPRGPNLANGLASPRARARAPAAPAVDQFRSPRPATTDESVAFLRGGTHEDFNPHTHPFRRHVALLSTVGERRRLRWNGRAGNGGARRGWRRQLDR